MKKIALLSAGLAAMIVPLLPATPAQAAFQTYVASYGSGETCSSSAPCNSFATALGVTDTGGQISCLDSGRIGFGAPNISRSVTIDCAGTSATTIGFTVSGAGVVAVIRNLTITGTSSGIVFYGGAALVVENCFLSNGFGIQFLVSAGAQLVVTNTTLTNIGSTLGGILVQPGGSGTFDVVLDHVRSEDNLIGVKIDGSNSTGVIQTTIRNSVFSGNKTGSGVTAVTTAGHAATTVSISRSHIVSNGTGVLSNGALAAVLLSNSTIQANGVALSSANGGALFSYKNNDINNNGTPGAAPTVVPQN